MQRVKSGVQITALEQKELRLETCINAFENTPTNEQIVGRNEN